MHTGRWQKSGHGVGVWLAVAERRQGFSKAGWEMLPGLMGRIRQDHLSRSGNVHPRVMGQHIHLYFGFNDAECLCSDKIAIHNMNNFKASFPTSGWLDLKLQCNSAFKQLLNASFNKLSPDSSGVPLCIHENQVSTGPRQKTPFWWQYNCLSHPVAFSPGQCLDKPCEILVLWVPFPMFQIDHLIVSLQTGPKTCWLSSWSPRSDPSPLLPSWYRNQLP